MLKSVVYFVVITLLTSCAVNHLPKIYDGIGDYEFIFKKPRETVTAETGHETLYEVTVTGVYSEALVQQILLGRCGELALENGCKYFYILQTDSKASTTTHMSTLNLSNNYNYYNRNYNYNFGSNISTTSTYNITSISKYALIYLSKEMIDDWDFPYNAQRYYDEVKDILLCLKKPKNERMKCLRRSGN